MRGVGEGVYGFSDGDWVVLTKQQGGTWNTAVNVDASDVVKIPRKSNLTEVNAATMTVRIHKMPVGVSSSRIATDVYLLR